MNTLEVEHLVKRFGSVTAVVAGQPVTPAYVHCLHDVEMDTGHEGFFRRNRELERMHQSYDF